MALSVDAALADLYFPVIKIRTSRGVAYEEADGMGLTVKVAVTES